MREYCYIIGENLQLYKIKTDAIRKVFEVISPLSIKWEINNKDVEELLKALKEELK